MQMGNPDHLKALMQMMQNKKPSKAEMTRQNFLQMLQTKPLWSSPQTDKAWPTVNGSNG